MEDLNKILITDSEFYNPESTYTDLFKKYNITTISQLLDDNFLEKYDKKCQANTRIQLRGLISMLKHKYFNTPLYFDDLLEEKIDIDKCNRDKICLKCKDTNKENLRISINYLLGCSSRIGAVIINDFCYIINKQLIQKNKDNIQLIDFLKWILTVDTPHCQRTHQYAQAYIDSYEQSKKIDSSNIDLETINNLNDQLKSLIEKKAKLDNKISKIKQQIALLSKGSKKIWMKI